MAKNNQTLKFSIYSALTIAFASLGDAFLYPFLAVNAKELDIPIVWVGVFLSINRFVRLVANKLMVFMFRRLGFKIVTILAASLAIITTFSYGVIGGIILWLISRIIWGVSFSALRISAISYALEHKNRSRSLGLNRSLHEAGPLLALLLGPVILQLTNAQTSFIILAIGSLPCLYFALQLPALKPAKFYKEAKRWEWPSSFNLLGFISSLIVEGMLVIVCGKLLLREEGLSLISITALSAFYLAYRRVCLVLLSPFAGWLSEYWGVNKVFIGSLLFISFGLLMISVNFISLGIILCFTFVSINAAIAPGIASTAAKNQLEGIAADVTFRDLGVAIGTLTGGFLLKMENEIAIFYLSNIVLLSMLVWYMLSSELTLKELIKWK